MKESDSSQSLLGKKLAAAKSSWLANAADTIILSCSFLLTTTSAILVTLIFHTQSVFQQQGVFFGPYIREPAVPKQSLSILQRTISALSVTITSAVLVVAGRRYLFFELKKGIRARRVAVYTNPSASNLVRYLVGDGLEPRFLAFLAIWALALVTGLVVNDAWAMVPVVESTSVGAPFGPINDPALQNLFFLRGSGQLSYTIASICSGATGAIGLINATGSAQLTSGDPLGIAFYPPPPNYVPNSAFSFSTALNGFSISIEPLSFVPSTAEALACLNATEGGFTTGLLWYEGGDNQTLSIIGRAPISLDLYRFNASAIVLGGTLHSTGNGSVFTPNGTTWPNMMSSDQWARDIASMICNTTLPVSCTSSGMPESFIDFSFWLNNNNNASLGKNLQSDGGVYWGTALGMAMGAYSLAPWPNIGTTVPVSVTLNSVFWFKPRYGAYVLIANIVVSTLTLVFVVLLRVESRLGTDFLNVTRLLLDPLKDPELFNASLDATVEARGNPYMLVRRDNEFLFMDRLPTQKSGHAKKWRMK